MTTGLGKPALGVLAAIAITSAMDATGLSPFSALPLLPLLLLFAYLQHLPRRSLGFVLARPVHYGIAALHPLLVLVAIAAAAMVAGAVNVAGVSWPRVWFVFARVSVMTALVVVLTEEGFFRGWLWASLRRAGLTEGMTLLASSAAFAAWHWSAVCLKTGFEPPPAQVPVFLVNAAVMGAIWGLLRAISGSVVVSSFCHGLWNGGAYVFFGFGTKVGKLGIQRTSFYGPEVGVLGLALNLLFALLLWRWWKAGSADRLS